MKRLILTSILVAGLTLSAWPVHASDNTLLGTGVGAALGGFVGSQFGKGSGQLAATGAGVFLGGVMGNSVGRSMDHTNSAYYSTGGSYSSFNSYHGYPSNAPNYVAPPAALPPQVIFVQPETIDYYTPRRRAVVVEGGFVGPHPPKHSRHCREFTQTIRIDGRPHESYGKACLRPDGSWQIEQ